MTRTWWKESVIYQIYPRSFNDSDGDGIGDIPGIYEKLDYIQSLGVDVIWLCPVYPSPNDDNGYDISDYRGIMPEFGTLEDFKKLLNGIHQRGMKLVMDLVANHTSDEHAWFEESRKSKNNPYRDYYFWKPGKDGGPPNNWKSFFGGSAWEKDELTDEYYLHLFTRKQPDLNWENPEVRKEIHELVRYWSELGVDGFRMDVISLISKRLSFEDAEESNFGRIISKYYANGPRVHEFLNEMNREVLSEFDIMTVGEGPGIQLENGLNYVDENRKELDMIFHFDHMFIDSGPGGKYDPMPVDLVKFKKVFSHWDEVLRESGWGSIFLGNHDFSRMVSRFGNDSDHWEQAAKLLCTLLLTLKGTVYIYQGDEIGMTNVAFPGINDYNDVETLGRWKEALEAGQDMDQFLKNVHKQSRDNARTPIQWNSETHAGFTKGKPWLKLNPNFKDINVTAQQEDQGSILNYYRKMIQLRKDHKTLVYGDYQCLLEEDPNLYIYRRWDRDHEFLVMHNMSDDRSQINQLEIDLDKYIFVIGNLGWEKSDHQLKPWQSLVLKKKP